MNFPTIKKLSADDAPLTRRILIYGDSGAGKTHLVGSAQLVDGMRDVLVCDIDSGSATLVGSDVSATATRTPQAVEQVLWLLAQKDKSVAHIRTLVLDGGSELQKRDLADIAAKAAQETTSRERDKDLNELADYKLNKSRLLRIFRMARDIPGINLVITAWAKKTFPKIPGTKQTNKDAGPTLVCPDFTDGVMDTLRGFCDDVWYLYYDTGTSKRRLVTSNYGPVVAKTRNANFAKKLTSTTKEGEVIPIIEEPEFSTIWKLYTEAVTATKGVK